MPVDKDSVDSCYTSAAVSALAHFPVEVDEIELVTQSENITFRVSVFGSDQDYVLRLHRPGYNTLEELKSERIWTRALKDAGILVPDALLTNEGQHFALIDIPDVNERRYAGMTTWAEGCTLSDYLETNSDTSERVHFFRRIGELAAAIHNQATCWQTPPGFARQRLGIDGLLGEVPRWGRFWEHQDLTDLEVALLQRERKRIRSELTTYGEKPDNFSLIHADLHPANIIYNDKDLALIDFDDSTYGWHMYELASALVEYVLAPDFDALRHALLDGYREHRPLADRDIALLPDFLLLRGMAIVGWFHQRPEHNGSEYFEMIKKWVIRECDSNER